MTRRLVGCALLAACAAEPAVPGPSLASTTIALSADGAALWLTSPDDDRVVRLDPETLEARAWYAVPDAPSHLALAGDVVLVTSALGASIHRIRDGAVEALATPCGGTGAVVARGGAAVVACPNDDRLLVVDLDAWRVTAVVPAPGRPAALGAWDGRLYVGGAKDGVVRRFDWSDGGLAPAGSDALGERPGVAAVQVAGIVPDPGGGEYAAAYQRVEHDADRDRPPEVGSYGALFDESPRIEPRLRSGCAGRYARFDGGPRVFSGPSAIAAGGGRLWVVHRATANVAVVECGGPIGAVRVGAGARGVAVSGDGRRAWIDVGFDHAVARIDAGAEPFVRRRETGPLRLSPEAERGRRIFHDATSPQITPAGVVACATCHPDGGEDGLNWFLHTPRVPRKLRRTPPAWGGRPALAPYHHDGAYDDAARLTRDTIAGLMDGTGLTVDAEAVAAWLAEIPPPPPRPGARAEGRVLFERAGCAECHPGPWYTDGSAHDLGLARDPDALRGPVQTPSLRGVRARAPYLHDGGAPDLRALLRVHAPALSEEEAGALADWLETL